MAVDVAEVLGYRMASDMTRILDDDERGTQIVSILVCDQSLATINESGLYAAILKSRKPEAKRFKKWVTAEVLPAIRKTGRYEAQPAPVNPATLSRLQLIEIAMQAEQERLALEPKVEVLEPKAVPQVVNPTRWDGGIDAEDKGIATVNTIGGNAAAQLRRRREGVCIQRTPLAASRRWRRSTHRGLQPPWIRL